MRNIKFLKVAVRRFFEGESVTTQVEEGAVQTPPPAQPQTPTPTPPPAGRTYTQAEFDRLFNAKVAEQKRASNTEKQKIIDQLEVLKQNQQLTQQEKEDLNLRIEELQGSMRTVEEQKKTEIDKLQKKLDTTTNTLTQERDTWKGRFESNMIDVDIATAGAEFEAVSIEQLRAFLKPLTRCTEKLDEANKPTGTFVTRVKFTDYDGEGKPSELDLSTKEAVKLMRDRPTRFGNMFKNATNGGTGASLVNPNPVSLGNMNIDQMSPQQYKAHQEKIHQAMRAGAKK